MQKLQLFNMLLILANIKLFSINILYINLKLIFINIMNIIQRILIIIHKVKKYAKFYYKIKNKLYNNL